MITKDIRYIGVNDKDLDLFEGQYAIPNGVSYNSYVILDDQVAVLDTVDKRKTEEFLANLERELQGRSVDYLVVNHLEPDHASSIRAFVDRYPKVRLVGNAKTFQMLPQYFELDLSQAVTVKEGDTLSLGHHELHFVMAPMVHWPDSMVTYDEYDQILFSNDAFGQHYASSKHFDDEVGLPEVLAQAKKYYANIVMPYSRHVQRALGALGGLDIDMIAPSHGVVWRSHVPEILETYARWSSLAPEEYAIVVYDSMWHTTEAMAHEILEAFIECGVSARLFDLKANHISDIMTEVLSARYVAVGSPTLNNGMMPTVAAFLCYLKGLSPKSGWEGRVGIPFGSYGWGKNGPDEVAEVLEKCGFDLALGTLAHQWTADAASLEELQRAVVSGLGK